MHQARHPVDLRVEDALRLVAAQHALLGARGGGAAARSLCQAVREVVGADGATFVLREGDRVYYAEEDAIAPLWKGRRFPVECCISGWAVLHARTAIVEDIFVDPRIPVEAYRPTFVRSLAMAPVGGDAPRGALGAYWRTRHRATDRELWLLEQLAGAAAELLRDPPPPAPTEDGSATRMLAVVAHDLRQPLSTIRAGAALLLEEDASAEITDLARRIARGAAEAGKLVEQILEYVGLEGGGLPLRLEDVDVTALCRSVGADLGPDVRVDGTQVMARCDPGRMRQVVGNLVRNAVEHGGATEPVTVRVGRDAEACWIAVHNRGPAIPPDLQPTMFLPFRRHASGRKGGSVGLGLYIVDRLVRAHGGRVEVRSTEAEGTTFKVLLPLGASMLDRPDELASTMARSGPDARSNGAKAP